MTRQALASSMPGWRPAGRIRATPAPPAGRRTPRRPRWDRPCQKWEWAAGFSRFREADALQGRAPDATGRHAVAADRDGRRAHPEPRPASDADANGGRHRAVRAGLALAAGEPAEVGQAAKRNTDRHR